MSEWQQNDLSPLESKLLARQQSRRWQKVLKVEDDVDHDEK